MVSYNHQLSNADETLAVIAFTVTHAVRCVFVLVRVNVCVEDNDFGVNLVINSTTINFSIAPLALIIRDGKCPDLQTTTKSQSPDSSHQLQSIFG